MAQEKAAPTPGCIIPVGMPRMVAAGLPAANQHVLTPVRKYAAVGTEEEPHARILTGGRFLLSKGATAVKAQ